MLRLQRWRGALPPLSRPSNRRHNSSCMPCIHLVATLVPLITACVILMAAAPTLLLSRVSHPGSSNTLPTLVHAFEPPFIPSFRQARALQKLQSENKRVLIVTNSDCDIARNMTSTILGTWAGLYGSSLIDVKIVVGSSGSRKAQCSVDLSRDPEDRTTEYESSILYLPECPDEYPPVRKVMCMWNYILHNFASSYDYFMKVDMDTYVNIPNLLIFLAKNPSEKQMIAGRVGTGRSGDLLPFCLGMGYIITRKTLQSLPSDAFENARLFPNSDVTFSGVIRQHLNLQCMDGVDDQFTWFFLNRYWDFHDGEFLPLQYNKVMQMVLPLNHVTSAQLSAATIHPIKTKADMYKLHGIVSHSRLPLVRMKDPKGGEDIPESLKPMCVYNPSQQYVLGGFYMRQCPFERPVRPKKITRAYVVYLPHRESSATRAARIANELASYGYETELHEGVDGSTDFESFPGGQLTSGELGLREAYRSLMLRILHSPEAREDGLYLIFEDDITFSPNFRPRLENLLQDKNCGAYLSSNSGGVLLLGATIWSNGSFPRVSKWSGGWGLVEHNRKESHYPRCYNFNIGVYGSYAQVMDIRALQMFYTWLNDPEYSQRPVDHAWNYLAERGIPVQVAFPYISVPQGDTSFIHKFNKEDDLEERRRLHRWYFEEV